jgi:hypothetical protein
LRRLTTYKQRVAALIKELSVVLSLAAEGKVTLVVGVVVLEVTSGPICRRALPGDDKAGDGGESNGSKGEQRESEHCALSTVGVSKDWWAARPSKGWGWLSKERLDGKDLETRPL